MKLECGGEKIEDTLTFVGNMNLTGAGDKWNVGAKVANVDKSETQDITVQASYQPIDNLMMFGSFNIALPE